MNQLSTDLPKLPTSAPPGKIKLPVLIYSLLVATINLFPAPSTPNRDLPFALAVSLLIVFWAAVYCTKFQHSAYMLSAVMLFSAANYAQVTATVAGFYLFTSFLLILTCPPTRLIPLVLTHIAVEVLSSYTSQESFNLASLIITLLFFIGLPFALRLLYEQKKATARAYADFQERTQEANLSLARELHDTVARHISLISLTAGQALTHSNPHPTHAALTAIDDSARQALADLRLLIQTTRTGAAHTDVLRDPTITTDLTHSMTNTATALRNQGFTVVTDMRVQPGDIPTGIHPTIHKVIQEIGFNASKYAPQGSTITITAKPSLTGITITASNPTELEGEFHEKPSTGHGLIGIAERITRLGGTIHYGTANGIWNLTINLPIMSA